MSVIFWLKQTNKTSNPKMQKHLTLHVIDTYEEAQDESHNFSNLQPSIGKIALTFLVMLRQRRIPACKLSLFPMVNDKMASWKGRILNRQLIYPA